MRIWIPECPLRVVGVCDGLWVGCRVGHFQTSAVSGRTDVSRKHGALFGQPLCARACHVESVWHWSSGKLFPGKPSLIAGCWIPDSD